MNVEKELLKRKSIRLRGFDYNAAGAYFLTICTQNKRQILSRIIPVGGDVLDAPQKGDVLDAPQKGDVTALLTPPNGGDVTDVTCTELSNYGKVADRYINQLNEFYDNIEIDKYVIMPDHIHILMFVYDDGASRTSPPTKQHSTVSRFVSTFKRFCNREYGYNIWQRYFYDHIIRDKEDYEEHLKYICQNPMRWKYDKLYFEE